MSGKDVRLHNGEKGSALGVRIIPRAKSNEIAEVLDDGTIKVRLTDSGADLNQSVRSFLAAILGVPVAKVDIVAGEAGRDKLVSILDMTPYAVNEKIIANLA